MNYKNPYQQYKKIQIDTADQGKLIVMLYDGAIKFINNAINLMPPKPDNMEEIHNYIIRAQNIITELMSSLNMEAGDISQRLFSIYMYINNRLIDANMKKELEPLQEVKKYLLELREAWEEAAKKAPKEAANSQSGGINIAT